jgi:hypothetical protein
VRRQISLISNLNPNQAWWMLNLVLPNGTEATNAISRAQLAGSDWGTKHHATYHRDLKTFTVILDLREE